MNAPAAPRLDSPRVTPNLRHAFGGVWRLTSRQYFAPKQWLVVLGPTALLGVLTASTVHRGESTSFYQLIGGFYLTFLVPVLAFVSGAGAIRDEMKSADYFVTRPLLRPAFLVFKYLAHVACVQLVYLFAFGVLIFLGLARSIADLGSAVPLLALCQVLEVGAFVAFGMFCGVISSRYLLIGLFYAGTVEIGIGQIPTQLNRLSITHQIRMLLEPIMQEGYVTATSVPSVLGTVAVILVFIVFMVALAATVFGTQEVEGSRPQDG